MLKSVVKSAIKEVTPEPILQEKYIDAAGIQSMDIFSDDVDIVIVGSESETEMIKITLTSYTDEPQMNMEINDGNCEIRVFPIERKSRTIFQIRMSSKLHIAVPAGMIPKWHVSSKSGDVMFSDNTTTAVRISSTSGDVQAENLFFDTMDIDTSSGDTQLSEVSGNIRCTASTGDINIVNLRNTSLILKTVSGEVAIKHSYVKKADLSTSSGDIKGRHIHIEKLLAYASSGDIELKNYSGWAEAHTSSGDITFELKENAPLDLMTSSGDVEVKLASPVLNTSLELSSHSGDITSDFAFSEKSDDDVRDSHQQKEHLVSVHSHSGDIHVHG